VTEEEAIAKAQQIWGPDAGTEVDLGAIIVYRVGYRTPLKNDRTFWSMGQGSSWEQAFSRAEPNMDVVCICGHTYTLHMHTVCPICHARPGILVPTKRYDHE
jgi:hypothetical protein